MSEKQIPWEDAKKWAEEHFQSEIIIVCSDGSTSHVLTWGKSPTQSANAAEGGNRIKDLVWPDGKPHTDLPTWVNSLIAVFRAAELLGANPSIHVRTDNLVDAVQEHGELIISRIGPRS